MKKSLKIIVLIFLINIVCLINVSAKETVKLYFFHGDGCPHCHEESLFLKDIQKKYHNDLKIVKYEVWYNENNQKLLEICNIAGAMVCEHVGVVQVTLDELKKRI